MEYRVCNEKLRLLLAETWRVEPLISIPVVVSKQTEDEFFLLAVQDRPGEESVGIRKDYAERYGQKEEEMFDFVLQNAVKNYPPMFGTIFEIIESITRGVKIPNSNPMQEKFLQNSYSSEDIYILTNEHGYGGAATAYYPNVLKNIGKVLDDDFFMIPSSVHEFFIFPEKLCSGEEQELRELILQGNREATSPEDFLSFDLRKYLRKEDKIIIVN